MFYTKCYRIKFFFRSCDTKICYRNLDGQHLQRCLHKQQKMIIIHRDFTNLLISTDRIRTDGWYCFKPRNLTTCTTVMPCHLYWPDPSAVDLRYTCVTCWQDLSLSQEVASHHWKNWQWGLYSFTKKNSEFHQHWHGQLNDAHYSSLLYNIHTCAKTLLSISIVNWLTTSDTQLFCFA